MRISTQKEDRESGYKKQQQQKKQLEHKMDSGYRNKAAPQLLQCGEKVKAKLKVWQMEC